MTINFTTLFTYIGHAANAADGMVTAYSSTIETDVRAFQDALDAETQAFQYAVMQGIEGGLTSLESAFSSAMTSLCASPVTNLIIETVHADTPLLTKGIATALAILIDQMDDNAENVDASTVSTTVSYGEGGSSSGWAGDNIGNGILVTCTKRGDGRVNEFILSETIRCEITATSSDSTATWKLLGEPTESKLSVDWPGGSGTSKTLTSYTGSSSANLVLNGDFSEEDDNATYMPEDWILETGTLGTTILVTDVEVQTVTINGTPTGGHYTLSFTDSEGRTYTTAPLAYNASGSDVQTALQELPFLGSVTVSSTGTSPDYTHTVTFLSVTNPHPLTYTSNLTGGTPTITVATPTPGSNGVMRGDRALEFNGNGSEQTSIYVPVTLEATTCYCCNLWVLCDIAPAAGTLTVDLVDGIDGTTVEDDQGTANTFDIDLTAVGTYPEAQNDCFHTPSNMPPQVYLRLKLSTALSNTTSLFVDEVALVKMTELYAGGLFVAAFTGRTDFIIGDEATITVVNNREGALHEWLNRFLDLAGKRLMLPTAATGTQDDTLIA